MFGFREESLARCARRENRAPGQRPITPQQNHGTSPAICRLALRTSHTDHPGVIHAPSKESGIVLRCRQMRRRLTPLLLVVGMGVALGPGLITNPTANACGENEQRFTAMASPVPESPTGGIAPGPIAPASVIAQRFSAPNAPSTGCGPLKSTPQCGSYQAVEVLWTPAQDSDTPPAMSLVRVTATGAEAKFLGPMNMNQSPAQTPREVGLYPAEGGRIVLEYRSHDSTKPLDLQIFLTPVDPQGNVGLTTTPIAVQGLGGTYRLD